MSTGWRLKAIVLSIVFCLIWLRPALYTSGADVSYYGVVKTIQFLQTNDTAPVVLATNGYGFRAFAVGSTNGAVTNATVKVGSNSAVPLLPDTNGLSWEFDAQFNSQSALDAAYPVGSLFSPVNYTLTMSTLHDGARSGSVNFFLFIVEVSYPTTPQLTGLAAAQAVDTTRDFPLTWNSLGGSSLAIVQLIVVDAVSNVVFSSPAPFQPGAMTGASTGYVIPAYSLPAGASLQGHLTIGNPAAPNTNSYPGAVGVAALVKDTQFPVTTRPAPHAPLLNLRVQAGQAQVQLSGETNRLYQLLTTPNLLTWTNLFTTNCASGAFTYTDAPTVINAVRFYRAKVGQ